MSKNLNKFFKIKSIQQNIIIEEKYYNKNSYVSLIKYNPVIGEVIYINVSNSYKNQGFGKQMLSNAIINMKYNNINEVYCFGYKNHPFWSNVYGKNFKFIWIEDPKLYRASTYDMYENWGKFYMKI